MNCVKCHKSIKVFSFKCPSCNTAFCLRCFDRHLSKKVCDYGKTDHIPVQLDQTKG